MKVYIDWVRCWYFLHNINLLSNIQAIQDEDGLRKMSLFKIRLLQQRFIEIKTHDK